MISKCHFSCWSLPAATIRSSSWCKTCIRNCCCDMIASFPFFSFFFFFILSMVDSEIELGMKKIMTCCLAWYQLGGIINSRRFSVVGSGRVTCACVTHFPASLCHVLMSCRVEPKEKKEANKKEEEEEWLIDCRNSTVLVLFFLFPGDCQTQKEQESERESNTRTGSRQQ